MNSSMERVNLRIERRYLQERIIRLQREIADWPMTDARMAMKREELHATRVELLGAQV